MRIQKPEFSSGFPSASKNNLETALKFGSCETHAKIFSSRRKQIHLLTQICSRQMNVQQDISRFC